VTTCDPITGAARAGNRKTLTPKMDEVLRALVDFTHRNKYQPSYRELSSLVGIANVHRYLVDLEARGWIRLGGGARAIEIPRDVYEGIVDELKTDSSESNETGD